MAATSPHFAHDLLVFIPAWNEEDGLGLVLAELAAELPHADVLVVDDGSTDGTARVARDAGVRVLDLGGHRGLGAAIAAGYGDAAGRGYRACGRVDADTQHPVAELRRLFDVVASGACDAAIGSRYMPGADSAERYRPPRWRRICTAPIRRLIAGTTGLPVHDPLSGMCVANRRATAVLARPYAGNAPEAEAVIRMHRAGLRVTEVAVRMRDRQGGRSKMTGGRLLSTLPTVAHLVRVRITAVAERRLGVGRAAGGTPPAETTALLAEASAAGEESLSPARLH